ncbi:hypothetical protein STTU_4300 [Streptomyces sp. Tu6071]|nr:hypothetical protein STTU_4300 [Streptomyces sp. Tu6071]
MNCVVLTPCSRGLGRVPTPVTAVAAARSRTTARTAAPGPQRPDRSARTAVPGRPARDPPSGGDALAGSATPGHTAPARDTLNDADGSRSVRLF